SIAQAAGRNVIAAASCASADHGLAGHDEIDRFRTFALFVGFDIEADALPLDQRLQSRAFDGGDVHEHITTAVVWFDEPVAALAVEKLDRAGHCHRELPRGCFAAGPHGATARLDIRTGKGHQPETASVTPPAPHRRRNV